ncbi:hypothetical protein CBL_14494 [Carabus blaptoides fortunei]
MHLLSLSLAYCVSISIGFTRQTLVGVAPKAYLASMESSSESLPSCLVHYQWNIGQVS